ESASAASPSSDGGDAVAVAPGLDQPTESLRVALRQDPTTKFLHAQDAQRFPTATLRNPFRMSPALYDMVKPKPTMVIEITPTPQPTNTPADPTPVKLPPPPPK